MTVAERFWRNVEQRDGCWGWRAAKCTFGYGKMYVLGKVRDAHRISWELHHGPIPEGMQVCHHCDNPECANPAHLFLGTPKDNTQDMLRKGRHRAPTAEQISHLTPMQVSCIRALGAARLKHGQAAKLCAEYGIASSTLSRIRRGLRWGDARGG